MNPENSDTKNNLSDNRTELRKVLEHISSEIYTSWLRDCDKVVEFIKLNKILEEIKNKDKIEIAFENLQDFHYFINKFSKDVITNILRQNIVFGNNGDSVAYETLLNYLQIFIKFHKNNEYAYRLWL